MSVLHINRPRVDRAEKRRLQCPTCKARRTFYCFLQAWYGWDLTCIGCGERWQDGERMPRPFEPRWRERSIQSARDRWLRGVGSSGAPC